MLYDSITAAIRTGVAALVGLLITWLLSAGVVIDDSTAASLNIALFGVVTAAYNALVIVLERKVNPWFGLLLGMPRTPQYRAGD